MARCQQCVSASSTKVGGPSDAFCRASRCEDLVGKHYRTSTPNQTQPSTRMLLSFSVAALAFANVVSFVYSEVVVPTSSVFFAEGVSTTCHVKANADGGLAVLPAYDRGCE